MARTASKTPSDSCPLYVMSKSSVRCKQLERIYPLVKNSYQISEEGIGARRLQQLLREGHARRLAHNQYLSTLRWQKMTPEEKHLARVIAYAKSCENPVFTHLSAAILHGIPVLKIPRTVHVRSVAGSPHSGISSHQDRGSHHLLLRRCESYRCALYSYWVRPNFTSRRSAGCCRWGIEQAAKKQPSYAFCLI